MKNKLNLKNWVRKLVLESINFDETYNDYQIEVDDITVPSLVEAGDMTTISMDINYNTNSGHSEQGQFSGPDHALQGEEDSIEIVNAVPVAVTVQGVEKMVKSLAPEQIEAIKSYVANYLAENESGIEEKILSSLDMNEEKRPKKSNVQNDSRKTNIIEKFETKVEGELSKLSGQDFIEVKVVHIPEKNDNLFVFLYFKRIKPQALNYINKTSKKLRGQSSIYYDDHKGCVCVKIVIPPLKHS